MKLTGGTTAWNHLNIPPVTVRPRLQGKTACDVVVIGGGMSGALASYVLSKKGADTILLERDQIGCGSTSANLGLLQCSNDITLTESISSFGEEQGTAFYKMTRNAVKRISEISRELSLDVQFASRSSLYFPSSEQDADMIRQEYDTLKRHGFDVEYWSREQITYAFPFAKPAALYTHGDAEVNPYRLLHALITDASRNGLRSYEHSKVKELRYYDDEVLIVTDHGEVLAKKVIWATGYETQAWKKDRNASLSYTYAIMTEPVEDLSCWHNRALIWETNRPYLYLRTTPDNRICAGGFDEPMNKPDCPEAHLKDRSKRLLKEIRSLFPGLTDLRIAYAWAGAFSSFDDGLPIIGSYPAYPHSYFIEGYGGNGTVYSMIAADLLAEAAAGRNPSCLSMFSFNRGKETSLLN